MITPPPRILALTVGCQLGLAMTQPGAALAQSPASDSAIQAIMHQRVDSGGSFGIVVGLLNPDGSRRVLAYGSAGGGAPLGGSSVFDIGSITKVFTGVLLADMAHRGDVRLQDPVGKYLPSTARWPTSGHRPITLLDLATYSGGLPRDPPDLHPSDPSNPYADYSVAELYAFLARSKPVHEAGTRYGYSNVEFGLLGNALARAAATSYETLLVRRVLAPLGMSDTRMSFTPRMRNHLAQGHDEFGEPMPAWETPALAGAGALRSTANDLLTFAAASLDGGRGALARALRESQQPRRSGPNTMRAEGLGWHVTTKDGHAVVWKDGATSGCSTWLGLDPLTHTAAVVLSNSSAIIDDIGFHLLDSRFPLNQPSIASHLLPIITARGVDAAIEEYQRLRRATPEAYNFGEDELNDLGYWLLRHSRVTAAVAIFELNTEMFPDAWNPYDSLGEAYLAAGDTSRAITNYQRSVNLNPGNTNGIEVLQRLRASP